MQNLGKNRKKCPKWSCFRQKIKVCRIFTGYYDFLSTNGDWIRSQDLKLYISWNFHPDRSTFRITHFPLSQNLTLNMCSNCVQNLKNIKNTLFEISSVEWELFSKKILRLCSKNRMKMIFDLLKTIKNEKFGYSCMKKRLWTI